MLAVVTKNVQDGISPRNSAKLLNPLLDECKNLQLQVEMAAYVEAMYNMRNLCYYLEGDGTDLPFKVAGRIQAFKEMYPNGQIKKLPPTKALVMKELPPTNAHLLCKLLLGTQKRVPLKFLLLLLLLWHKNTTLLLRLMQPSIDLEGLLPLMLSVLQP
jgi:hypothetical protein